MLFLPLFIRLLRIPCARSNARANALRVAQHLFFPRFTLKMLCTILHLHSGVVVVYYHLQNIYFTLLMSIMFFFKFKYSNMCCCCFVVCQFSTEHKSFLCRAALHKSGLQILRKYRLTNRAAAFANIFTHVRRLFGGIYRIWLQCSVFTKT